MVRLRPCPTAGTTVTPLFLSLVALYTEGDTAKKLEGLALKNVNVTLWINHKKASEQFGEMVFTDAGVSGPVILSLSRDAVNLWTVNSRSHLDRFETRSRPLDNWNRTFAGNPRSQPSTDVEPAEALLPRR
jgi:predicted flavoprotein YhiN